MENLLQNKLLLSTLSSTGFLPTAEVENKEPGKCQEQEESGDEHDMLERDRKVLIMERSIAPEGRRNDLN